MGRLRANPAVGLAQGQQVSNQDGLAPVLRSRRLRNGTSHPGIVCHSILASRATSHAVQASEWGDALISSGTQGAGSS